MTEVPAPKSYDSIISPEAEIEEFYLRLATSEYIGNILFGNEEDILPEEADILEQLRNRIAQDTVEVKKQLAMIVQRGNISHTVYAILAMPELRNERWIPAGDYTYAGLPLVIEGTLPGGLFLREGVWGEVLVAETEAGDARFLVILSDGQDKASWKGTVVAVDERVEAGFQIYLENKPSADQLQSLGITVPASIMPEELRVTLANLTYNDEERAIMHTFHEKYGLYGTSIVAILGQDRALQFVQTILEAFPEKGQAQSLVRRIMEVVYDVEMNLRLYAPEEKDIQLVETALISMIHEFESLVPAIQPEIDQRDPAEERPDNLALIALAFSGFRKGIWAALAIQNNEEIDLSMEDHEVFNLDTLVNLPLLRKRYPEAKYLCQALNDYMLVLQIDHQEKAAQKTDKAAFYQKYNQGSAMSETAPTTDSQKDIARFTTLIQTLVEKGFLSNEGATVLLGGIGIGDRFEGPLFAQLAQLGIRPGRFIATDLNDYSAHFPPNLRETGVTFIQEDMTNPDFHLPEQVDLALLPWSLSDDIVEVKALLRFFLQKLPEIVKKGGNVALDKPAPIGENSHLELIKKAVEEHGVYGVAEYVFKDHEGQDLKSLFNFYDLCEVLGIMAQADFLPLNFPEDPVQQQEIIENIQAHEGQLKERAESKEDINGMTHAIWYANGKNRATFACQRVSREELDKKAWFARSAFMQIAFPRPE